MTTKPSKGPSDQIDKINPKYQWNSEEPSVLVFDVNETLINFESMNALFERIYGDKHVMREWLGHLIMYSMTLTLSGLYVDYYSLGQGLLQMIGSIKGVNIRPEDHEEIKTAMMTMPAHSDVVEGLKHLKKLGYRMVTLTNSPPNPSGKSPLEQAGLAGYFERQFSIETVRSYKPSPCCMVAAHVWDTIGAQSAGFSAALITRPGNAPLPTPGLPQPNFVAKDLIHLAKILPSVKGV
jgi:2-haloacid dehalogenase